MCVSCAQFDIYHGAGHSYGSHSKSYRATDASWVLGGAGYNKDPGEQAAHVQALYSEIDTYGEILVTLLYQHWRPELLALEKAAKTNTTEAGERMRTWLHMVRHCITAWVVSTAARPRDRFGYILAACDTKADIVSPSLSAHMDAIYDTDEYAELAKLGLL